MYCSNVFCLLIFLCGATCQHQTQLPEGSRCLFLNTTGTCVNLYKCTSAAIYYDRMELHKYNESLCSSMFPPHRHLKRGYDTDTQLCFGRQDKTVDTCQGDSGGPLHADIAKCSYFVFGVTSFGKDCGIRGNAGIYTRVRHYVPWIESIVWPDS